MAQRDLFKRYLEAGMAFSEMTRSRARAIVNDLVKAGELPRERAEKAIDEVVEQARRNTEAVTALVRAQVREQLGALGIATKADIARLEAKIQAATKKAPAAKSAAKKTPAATDASA